MRKKFGLFKEKYSHIISMLEKGYPYTDVILDLKDKYQLDLSFNTFRSYLYRYRKELNLNANTSTKTTSQSTDLRNHLTNIDTSNSEDSPQLPDSSDEVEKPKQTFKNRASGDAFIARLLNES